MDAKWKKAYKGTPVTPPVEGPTWINSPRICSSDRMKESCSCKQQVLGKHQPQAEPVHNCARDLWVVTWFLRSWRSLDHAWAKAWLTFTFSILLHFAVESSLGLSEHKGGSLLCFLQITGEKTSCCFYLGLHQKGCSRVPLSSSIPEFDNLRWPLFEFLLGKVRENALLHACHTH